MQKRRPNADEYGQFYQGYISHVEGDDLLAILTKNKTEVANFFHNLPAEKWDYAYAPGKWTPKDVLLHLIDGERVFSYRALRISRGDVTALPGFDQDVFAKNANANGRTPASLLDEYEAVRECTLLLYRQIGDEAADRIGTASGYPASPLAIGYIIAGHELHHLRIIKERYF